MLLLGIRTSPAQSIERLSHVVAVAMRREARQ